MKKLVALFVVMGLLLGVAGTFTADAAVKKVAKKKAAKKVMKKAAPKVAPKAAPAPAPVAPVLPPPAPVSVKPAPTGAAPLFGLGLNSNLSGLYLYTGKGALGTLLGRVDLVLDDPLALGSMVGLTANSVKYRVGLGGVYGKDNTDKSIGAIPVFADAVVSLPADMMGGIESYVGGGVNYNLYGTGRVAGPYGIQAYYGILSDLGLGLGKTAIQVGYSVLRASGRSSKGITVSVGMPLVL